MENSSTKKTPSITKKDSRYFISVQSVYGPVVISLFILGSVLVPLSIDPGQQRLKGATDIDVSGNGHASAFDGKESIATHGDSFCTITNDIAGGRFSSLFDGIVDCNDNSQTSNQFLVYYSYTKNPVKIGENTYLTITVKNKETGDPISNAVITLAIGHTSSSLSGTIVGTALAAAGASTSALEGIQSKTTQTMNTDHNGHATFTVQLGPKSDLGTYDTEIEVKKDSYQSSLEHTDLRVV